MPHRLLEHTADIRVEITGASRPELFAAAADCVFGLMLDRSKVRAQEALTVELRAVDAGELFMDWLRELLFLFSARGLALGSVSFSELTETRLRALVQGERFDPARHGLKLELKVPTYHQFSLEVTPAGWRALVIFDA